MICWVPTHEYPMPCSQRGCISITTMRGNQQLLTIRPCRVCVLRILRGMLRYAMLPMTSPQGFAHQISIYCTGFDNMPPFEIALDAHRTSMLLSCPCRTDVLKVAMNIYGMPLPPPTHTPPPRRRSRSRNHHVLQGILFYSSYLGPIRPLIF